MNVLIVTENWPTGLTNLGLTILRSDDTQLVARSTSGIVESPAGSGRYSKVVDLDPANFPLIALWDSSGDYTSSVIDNRVDKELIRSAVEGHWRDEADGHFELTISDT